MEKVDSLTELAIMELRGAMNKAGTTRLIIICDPTLDDPLYDAASRLSLPCRSVALSLSQKAPKPYLIEIKDETKVEAFVNESLKIAVREAVSPAPWDGRARSVCGWLITQKGMQELSSELIECSRFRDTANQGRTYRFWDPRTMQFAHELTGTGVACSCLTDTAWGFIDSFGQWKLLPARGSTTAWKRPNLSTLNDLSMLNASLQRLCIGGVVHGPNVLSELRHALRIGKHEGMTNEDDLIRFAADRVALGAPIEKAHGLRELLTGTREGFAHYHRIVADYDKDDWQAVLQSIPTDETIKD